MSKTIVVNTLEELNRFLNDKGVLEIAMRNKNKRFKVFQKIAIEKLQQSEAKESLQNAIALLNRNNQIGEASLKALGAVSKLSKFSLVLNGLNLCATCAGFAIMCVKLDQMSSQIAEVIALYKESNGIHIDFEFKKVQSEHSNMLDCRKTQKYYTEAQMRELVASEYNVLDLLLQAFNSEITRNKEALVFSILSTASMLSTSLRYFDEIYYFNNKETIGNGNRWHSDHDLWVSILDRMLSQDMVERIQDYGFFDLGLNTEENDCLYLNYLGQIRSLKQDIEDSQNMISAIDDPEILKMIIEQSNRQIREEIEKTLEEAGMAPGLCEEAIQAAVA